jgi:hypothetical protein
MKLPEEEMVYKSKAAQNTLFCILENSLFMKKQARNWALELTVACLISNFFSKRGWTSRTHLKYSKP